MLLLKHGIIIYTKCFHCVLSSLAARKYDSLWQGWGNTPGSPAPPGRKSANLRRSLADLRQKSDSILESPAGEASPGAPSPGPSSGGTDITLNSVTADSNNHTSSILPALPLVAAIEFLLPSIFQSSVFTIYFLVSPSYRQTS